jgi:hypothetical protein
MKRNKGKKGTRGNERTEKKTERKERKGKKKERKRGIDDVQDRGRVRALSRLENEPSLSLSTSRGPEKWADAAEVVVVRARVRVTVRALRFHGGAAVGLEVVTARGKGESPCPSAHTRQNVVFDPIAPERCLRSHCCVVHGTAPESRERDQCAARGAWSAAFTRAARNASRGRQCKVPCGASKSVHTPQHT